MSSIEFGDLGSLGPPGLKDVMKLIALRRNIQLEDPADAGSGDRGSSSSGSKSRRTLGK